MNERAAQLGMSNTHFENVTGLDDSTTKHLTSAYDIALMSRELLKHELITKYATIWMDSIRDGAFGLTNTNRLVRFYKGITGLKTGSTSKAGFCMSATAKRDGMHLIAVVMGSPTRDIRNETAKQLLDYGFANYSFYEDAGGEAGRVSVPGGTSDECEAVYEPFSALLPKGKNRGVTKEILLDESVPAPVKKGDRVGTVRYLIGTEVIGEAPVTAGSDVERIGFLRLFLRFLGTAFLKSGK